MPSSRSLGSLTVDVLARTGAFTDGMTKAQRDAVNFRRNVSAQMQALQLSMDRSVALMRTALGGLVAGVGLAGLSAAVKNTTKQMLDLGAAAGRVNMPVAQFSAMAGAAGRSDVSVQSLERALNSLQRRANSKGSADAFASIGIDPSKTSSIQELFDKTIEGLRGVSNESQRTALAAQTLGRAGTALMPVINQGSAAFREQMDHARALGLVLDDVSQRNLAAFDEQTKELQQTLEGLRRQFVTGLIPVLEEGARGVTDFLQTLDLEKVRAAGAALGELLKHLDEIAVFFAARFAAARVLAAFAAITAGAGEATLAVRALGAAMGLLGGPIGIVTTLAAGAALGVYELASRQTAAEKATSELDSTLRVLRTAYSQLTPEQQASANQSLRNADAALKEAQASLVLLQAKRAELEQIRKANTAPNAEPVPSAAESATTLEIRKQQALVDSLSGKIADVQQRLAHPITPPTAPITKPLAEAAEGTKEVAKAAKAARDEFAELLNTLDSRASGVTAQYQHQLSVLYAGFQQGRIGIDKYRAAVTALIGQQKFAQDATRAQKEAEDALAQTLQQRTQQNNAIAQQNESLRDEIARVGLSKEQLSEYARAKIDAAISTDQERLAILQSLDPRSEEIALVRDQIAALQEQKQLMGTLYDKQEQDAQSQAWAQSVKQMGDQFTDALIQGGASVRDALKRMFQNMVLRPIIAPIMAGVAGGIGALLPGTASAATGAGGGSGSTGVPGASLLGSLGGTLGLGASVMSAGQAGAGFASIANYASAGQYMNGVGVGLGMAGAYLGAVGAGMGVGSLIAGGYSVGSIGGALAPGGAALGAAIGSFVPGVGTLVGGLAGGALGGGVNALFGRKYKSAGIEGTFSADGFSGDLWRYYKGGLFASNKTTRDPLAGDAADQIGTAWQGLLAQVGGYADALGLQADQIAGFTHAFETTFDDKNVINDPEQLADAVQKALQDAMTSGSNALAEQLLGANSPYAKAGEQAIDTLSRLATSLTGVNAAFDTLGLTLYQGSLQGAGLASSLVDMFGGMDQLQQAAASYFQNFYSADEQRAAAEAQVRDALASVNLVLPDTKDGFRALVDSLDLTTASGQQAFTVLMGVQDTFAQLADTAAEAAAQAAQELSDQIAGLFSDTGPELADILASQLLGTFDGDNVGAAMAQATTAGIYNAIAGGFAQQISNIIVQGVVQPIVTAAVTGANVAQAVSAAAISDMVARAQQVAAVAGQVLAELKSSGALDAISDAVKSISVSVPTVRFAAPAVQQYTAAVKDNTSAADAAARAAQQLADAWGRVSDSLLAEVQRIRGVVAGDAGQGLAYWQAQFAVATAQARAGDQDVAGQLTSLSRSLLDAAAQEATSALGLQQLQASVAQSLQNTAAYANAFAGGARPAAIAPRSSTRAGMPMSPVVPVVPNQPVVVQTDPDLSREVRALRELVERQGAVLIDVNERQLRLQQSAALRGVPA